MNPQSAAPGPAASPRPRLVDFAAGATFLAAAVNLAIAVLVVAQVSTVEPAPPFGLVVVLVVITVAYSAALVTLTILFRRGRTWARGALLSVASLSLLTLFALNALNLMVILLLVLACVLLYRRPVSAWVRSVRGIPRT